jgi:hypothetical protein
VEGSCEHGNEPSGSIKCWEVLECMHNWRLLKKGSAPRVSEMATAMYTYVETSVHQHTSTHVEITHVVSTLNCYMVFVWGSRYRV